MDRSDSLPDQPAVKPLCNLVRTKEGHESDKVSFIELFFDLVFVFAVTQLSHSLIGHFHPMGGLQTLMLMLAVWWVWGFTTWVTNWLDPERLPVRFALLVLMVFGLVLSAAIPLAFEKRGIAFAGAYVAMQVGRSLFFLWAVRGRPDMVLNYQRILSWLVASGVLWIAGGLADPSSRMAWWGAALVIEYISPALGFYTPGLGKSASTEWNVSGHHIAERCGLFIIIALGESILVTGATFSDLPWTAPVITAFTASLVGSIAMWWLYFDVASGYGTRVISAARDPGHLARVAYTYLHTILVAGIILSAAADEFVLGHPSDPSGKITFAVVGGPALYLFGNLLFKRSISRRFPASHFAGIVLLGILAYFGGQMAPWLLTSIVTLILCAVAMGERLSRHAIG